MMNIKSKNIKVSQNLIIKIIFLALFTATCSLLTVNCPNPWVESLLEVFDRERPVTSIAITTPPAKTTYFVGDTLDLTGLVVTAIYDNGATAVIASFDYGVSGFNPSTPGTQTIQIVYDFIHTAHFTVTVVGAPEMVSTSTNIDWPVAGSNPPGGTATLSVFSIARYEVTQELYLAVMGYNPSIFSSNPAAGEVQEKRPVENVTWFDAIEFCNKLSEKEGLTPAYSITGRTPATGYPITAAAVTINEGANGYRLPTEVQWQYAAQSGDTAEYDTTAGDVAWYSANSNSITHEVGKKAANTWGLYDMLGNVWEWCWDWHGSDYPDPNNGTNPTGAASGSLRIYRGGSWYSPAVNVTSANRSRIVPSSRGQDIGFRVALP